MSTERNRQVLQQFDPLLGSDDLRDLDELCTPNMVNHALAPDRPAGLAGTREFLRTQGHHQVTGQRWEELIVVAEGDYVVQFGRRDGDWAGGELMAYRPGPARTFGTSRRCTASRTGSSRNVGWSATISGC